MQHLSDTLEDRCKKYTEMKFC